ncbi:unnamed protein product, partial [Allacma fusca]
GIGMETGGVGAAVTQWPAVESFRNIMPTITYAVTMYVRSFGVRASSPETAS